MFLEDGDKMMVLTGWRRGRESSGRVERHNDLFQNHCHFKSRHWTEYQERKAEMAYSHCVLEATCLGFTGEKGL